MLPKRSTRIRVNFDPDLADAARKAARAHDCTVSALIYRLVDRELRQTKSEPDRNTVVLEYASVQLDLILAHLNPELKKKAREIFRAKTAEGRLPLGETGNAV